MTARIPDSHRALLDGPVFVTLSTVMPDGQPQSSVIWCNYDGTHIWVNSAAGRQKDRNMRERPMATILAIDPEDPYRYLEVRASVDEITEEGAVDHIDALARLYEGVESYYGGVSPAEAAGQETRVIYKLRPTRVVAHPPAG